MMLRLWSFRWMALALAVTGFIASAEWSEARPFGGGFRGGAGYRGGYRGGYYDRGFGYDRGFYGSGVGVSLGGYPGYDYAPGYAYTPGESGVVTQSMYPPPVPAVRDMPAAAGDLPAQLNISLPSAGSVMIGDFQAQQAAGSKLFQTPALTPGKTYSYDIEARWMENGQERKATKTVTMRAGDTVQVDFRNATGT